MPQAGEYFLSLNDTVEVIDNSSGLKRNGKYYYIESGGYGHYVVSMKHKDYPGIMWLEVNI